MTEDVAEEPGAGSRLRALWARVRSRNGAERRDAFGEPWTTAFRDGLTDADPATDADTEAPAQPASDERAAPRFGVLVGRDAEPAVRLVTELPVAELTRLHAEDFHAVDPGRDAALVAALHRVADSFERVAASLDADRRERRTTLDDIDSLLRALVRELRSPAAVAPVVVGGSIDATGAGSGTDGDDELDLTEDEPDTRPRSDRRPFERARPH